jgi:hypothetical protein
VDFIGGTGSEWWKLSSRLERALREASRRLDPDGNHSLRLGSPVLIGAPGGDQIRAPVILAGGGREVPVAYLRIERTSVDSGRIDTLARRLESMARAMLAGASAATGRQTEIVYP